jgi:pyruvate/2-oxoglutarate dehydrogenase complex dihydrolipoamide acyltransferase (E2) component
MLGYQGLDKSYQLPIFNAGKMFEELGFLDRANSRNVRLSDGAEAARFMQALAVYLEEPLRLVV